MEEWLRKLLEVSHTSLYQLVLQALDSDLPVLEELVCYQVTQVSCVAIHHQWTRECEQVCGHGLNKRCGLDNGHSLNNGCGFGNGCSFGNGRGFGNGRVQCFECMYIHLHFIPI